MGLVDDEDPCSSNATFGERVLRKITLLVLTDATAKSHEKEMVLNDDNLIARLSEFREMRLGLGCGPWFPVCSLVPCMSDGLCQVDLWWDGAILQQACPSAFLTL